jgi:Flp pilus assembly protein TadD
MPEGPPAPDGAGRLLGEPQLLAAALQKLRRDHQPAAALELLDQHTARYPSGALIAEATVARVDALLALGRRRDAREVLERVSLSGYPRRRELLVLRGELATEAGDCADALLDLDIVARIPAGDEIEERATYGKAVCLARLGQRHEAGTILQAYLRRFPNGRFVKSSLESLLDE